ncbi:MULTISPECIES: hypothetical protein [unclassified Novosphingobium]|uniref:hypothetical protein n=1 Tax=unclassified Novosphingobium TaxID=2644732 RepID=UPI000D4FC43A|nr:MULTISPECIES: hypothetical protein [unclassified Novosphingobium]PTR08896.1 hypothetical protein C8K11_110159 [Novosphingobium sp. GV055]PUB01808.1 hypothetical protein C8K12_110159 [Novosphingobium sp. GV061]PUB17780.1 hypothetical protein C8K14_110159 [Novosphingobium sp. GV079]PUB40474.1 hypothetical protein C8K10_110159 [Novosphingobium sp. GV027]
MRLPRSAQPVSLQRQTIVIQCECGAEHRSPDAIVPAGWTTRHGAAWCVDCTRVGVPVRQLLHGGSRAARRRAA